MRQRILQRLNFAKLCQESKMPKQKLNGRICHYCGKRKATQVHEEFPDTKPNRRLYGDLIDDPRNAFPACTDCNSSHAHIILIDEFEFCKRLGIEPRSKEASIRRLRERNFK